MAPDAVMFNKLVAELVNRVPTFKIRYKDESILMKFLGAVLFFTPRFMTSYTTTIGTTVYFPNRKWVDANSASAFEVLCHEYVHVCDKVRHGVWFELSYLFPQIFALLSLLGFLGFKYPVMFLCFTHVIFAAPYPSIWRRDAEARGYAMSVAVRTWLYGEDSAAELLNAVIPQFTGWAYYKMWPFAEDVRRLIRDMVSRANEDDASEEMRPYAEIKTFLKRNGLIRG